MSDVNPVSPTPTPPGPRFRAAFQQLLGEIQAVPTGELIIINIDIPTAVGTALGALPGIVALRPRVVSEAPQVDIARFDKLEAYTQAAWYAHSAFVIASTPAEPFDTLVEQATSSRQLLFSDASALAERGLVDKDRLQQLKGPNGFKNIALDLYALASMMRDNWTAISGKTAIQMTEIDQAEVLGERLITAIGLREQGPELLAESAENRQKAFTLFVNAYDQIRRVISFLRWDEDDVDQIAPSLYAGRATGRRKGTDNPIAPVATASPVAPVAPSASTAASTSSNGSPAVAVGHPQSSPFTGA